MSNRRRLKQGCVPASPLADGVVPAELLSRFHRAWSDPARIARTFPGYATAEDVTLLRSAPGSAGLVHQRVLGRWAAANGFAAERGSGADWHKLTAAGLNGGPAPAGETRDERRARHAAFADKVRRLP